MGTKAKPKVAILGGTGGMGRLVGRLLTKHHFEVYPLGRESKDFESTLQESDIILLSVPATAFDDVLRKIGQTNVKNKLLVDLSSGVVEHVKKLGTLSTKVGFIHLMFGPDIYLIENQNIIVSDTIKDPRFQKLISVFRHEGAHITFSSPAHHDMLMGIVQALSQFTLLSLAKTISESKTSTKELQAFASITFSLQVRAIVRVMAQHPELWASIQFNNEYVANILKHYLKNIGGLAKIVQTKDYRKFGAFFESASRFWKEKGTRSLSLKSRRAQRTKKSTDSR